MISERKKSATRNTITCQWLKILQAITWLTFLWTSSMERIRMKNFLRTCCMMRVVISENILLQIITKDDSDLNVSSNPEKQLLRLLLPAPLQTKQDWERMMRLLQSTKQKLNRTSLSFPAFFQMRKSCSLF